MIEESQLIEILQQIQMNGKIFYRVKWKNLIETWESEEKLCKCESLISKFKEQKLQSEGENEQKHKNDWILGILIDENANFLNDKAEKIVGGKKTNGDLYFFVKWFGGDSERYSWMSNKDCRENIPKLLIDYYESRMTFSEK
eukprot:c7324_g1_i1.p1 GENE.c7324_g1_i1~~c7324_g1_i1.p1  ORF type:complete len:162 (-),score=57.62 c7324_g1_i1:134-559(-)